MRAQGVELKPDAPPFLLLGASLLQLLRRPRHCLDESLGLEGMAGKQTARAGYLLLGSNRGGSEDWQGQAAKSCELGVQGQETRIRQMALLCRNRGV